MEQQALPWTLAERFSFRFIAIFFILTMFPFPANLYPDEAFMDGLQYIIWQWPVQWIATHLIGIPGKISTRVTGSGDTTFHWILFGLTLFISLLGAVIWSALDRKRAHYQLAMRWLRVYTRYYLAYMLFVYGIIKVFHVQMTSPSLNRLSEPFGDFSLMGVLWSFLGVSKAYSAFSGWSEVIGGSLLLFRRTTLLGALVSFGVILNVFVLNMCYDVPVKLFSFFLLLTCAFLIAPDFTRLLRFFIFQKPVEAPIYPPLFEQKKWKIVASMLKIGVITWILYSNVLSAMEVQKQYGDLAVPAPLSGIYKVETFERNHTLVSPLMTDSTYWHKLLVRDFPAGKGRITMANEHLEYCTFKVDTLRSEIDIHSMQDTIPNIFTYEQPSPERLIIKGLWMKDSVVIVLKKVNTEYRLLNSGFHWVNEFPNNK